VIGASTGGPRAIETVLNGIGAGLPVPIVIVQHMPAGFTRAFAERLDRILPFHVWEIAHGDALHAGTVGIAPAGRHARIERRGAGLIATLHPDAGDALHVPSVDNLFASAAEVTGARTVAALLTGMGADGANGMLTLAQAGAQTIAQDEASCVVYGMPRVAVLRGGVRESLPLDAIGGRLAQFIEGGFDGL
jgi:two-component system chemotaxis response regulator CheB